jgi:hypothetical protein
MLPYFLIKHVNYVLKFGVRNWHSCVLVHGDASLFFFWMVGGCGLWGVEGHDLRSSGWCKPWAMIQSLHQVNSLKWELSLLI